jgi:molybdopterin converting factor small subunit
MAIIVIIPTALRPLAAHNERVFLEAKTAGEALTKLFDRFPALDARLPDNLDNPPPGVALYRNSKDLRTLQGLATPLQNDDRLTIIVPEGDV